VGDGRDSPEESEGEGQALEDAEENRLIRFYHGLRRDVSLLLSEGHQYARDYPVAVAWSEARIVRQRNADKLKQDRITMQMTIASVFDSNAGKQLAKLLKRIDESD
jgi:hypothetical protein